MKNLPKKVFWWVLGTHAAVLFLIAFIPWVADLFHPVPKEIITYVSVESAPAPAPVTVVQPPVQALSRPEPEPEPAPEPEPEVKPEPKPQPVPEPKPVPKPAPKAPPKVTPPKTNQPPAVVKKPATKPAVTVQKQTKRVTRPAAGPARPALDLSGVKSALQSGGSSSGGSSSGGGTYSPFAGYYESVKQKMYAAWRQPVGVPIGLTAKTVIRVEISGAVSSRSLVQRSGNAEFDRSVQAALDAVSKLPAPPADLPDRNINIEFELSR